MEKQGTLTIATLGRIDIIAVRNLVRIEATSNYSRLFLENGTSILVAKVLKKFEAELEGNSFIRTHKTHLVNLHYIRACSGILHKTLHLENGDNIAVSRSKQHVVMKRLMSLQAV